MHKSEDLCVDLYREMDTDGNHLLTKEAAAQFFKGHSQFFATTWATSSMFGRWGPIHTSR
eukprot:2253689-Amphidinium_carterae.2